jgi:hypothetical protein
MILDAVRPHLGSDEPGEAAPHQPQFERNPGLDRFCPGKQVALGGHQGNSTPLHDGKINVVTYVMTSIIAIRPSRPYARSEQT